MSKKQVQKLPQGNKKKSNRVKRTDIGYINDYGFEVTFEEQEKYRQLVNRAKRKSKNITSKYDGSYRNYAKGFATYSTSIKDFKNRESFERAVKSMESFTKRDNKKIFAKARKEDMLLSLDHLGYGQNSKLNSDSLDDFGVIALKKIIKSMTDEQLIRFWDDGQSFFNDVYQGDIDEINDKLDTLGVKARMIKRGGKYETTI